ncbi:hypothetical protein [Vibrio harveyi]
MIRNLTKGFDISIEQKEHVLKESIRLLQEYYRNYGVHLYGELFELREDDYLYYDDGSIKSQLAWLVFYPETAQIISISELFSPEMEAKEIEYK